MKFRNLAAGILSAATLAATLAGCTTAQAQQPDSPAQQAQVAAPTAQETAPAGTPKYVFLFIGDGMSYAQIQAAAYYQGAVNSKGGVEAAPLSFMGFPVAGSAQTYDSTSFAPDSASTATSIATGHKTWSGTINMDTTFTTKFEAISEQLKAQNGWKVGVVTTVNLNHATPAAFYAHQQSRGAYYDIGLEMVESGFEYFAGGDLLAPTGSAGEDTHIYEVAEAAGYTVVTTQAEAAALKAGDEKVIVIGETLADASALSYDLDAAAGEWVLADYVEKGIELLDNDNGFFLMVEGGKIDWSGHANDAAANINDTLALSNAVQKAIDFYNQHPNDTLILVTGDHETGGLSIGYAGTNYDTYLTNLANQTISYAKYDADYVSTYKENNTSFEDVLADVEALFGLKAAGSEDDTLVLTAYELGLLQDAYGRTMAADPADMTEAETILYGPYEPLSVTITHLLNNKSGIGWTSYAHTGVPVPVFALGAGQELFEGYYDNTDIYHNLASLTGVE